MATPGDNFITIVSGLPRSGTSMMMRMLERGGMPVLTDGARSADDDNPLGYYELEAVKRLDKDKSWLPDAYGKAVKAIYVFLYSLPNDHRYKVLFMKRNLEEVVASQKVMLQRRQEEGGRLTDQQLADSFSRQLQKLDEWIGRQENFAILYLDYNKLLGDPETAVFEIDRFLGLQLNTDAMIEAVDPTLHRQRSDTLS